MKVGNYSSILSQLVYDSQIFILLHCYDLAETENGLNVGDNIVQQRDRWLLNTSRGPIGEINSWRSYAMATNASTVQPAQIRWYTEDFTLVYQDVIYKISHLQEEIYYCIKEAEAIFTQELCLNLPNIPIFPVNELVDNWDNELPGESFITDTRNTSLLSDMKYWLLDHTRRDQALSDTIFMTEAASDRLVFRPAFAQQYEASSQRFLEQMFVLLYKGSGQPGRRPEMLGTRWCNLQHDKRNIFLHDGFVLFILNYHKSINRTHAGRHPIRFLFPPVSKLLIQYLVLIIPFREWLSHETRIPSRVSEYLWSDHRGIWIEDRVTDIIKQSSLASTGVQTHIQAWRQIAVGIAIKFFSSSQYQGDFDLPDDEGKVGLPDVFHYQAAHTSRTGNQVYGGTIDFEGGLTDAALQGYLYASQCWHHLIRDPPQSKPPLASVRKHRRTSSSVTDAVSPHKSTFRPHKPRRQHVWALHDAQVGLQSLFGPHAEFRSPLQARLIQSIIGGESEVVGILATGEGKSLTFMLPSQLQGAGTTVVIIPLIALRQDLTRRCADLQVQFAIWNSDQDDSRYPGCPLLFVSVEAAVGSRFSSFLARMDAQERLDRVILDEAHLVLCASDYRPKLRAIRGLRGLRCQFVFLSATVPPVLMADFHKELLLSNPTIIRSSTFRGDLSYHVKVTRPRANQSFLQVAAEAISYVLMEADFFTDELGRAIIYASTQADVEELSSLLNCESYHSKTGSNPEKAAVLTHWIEGRYQIVVATSAFGVGIDYPHVRFVFHINAPYEMISFAQEVGRAGRDGAGGVSIIFLPSSFHPAIASSATFQVMAPPQQAMQIYLGRPRCLSAALSNFLDGVSQYCSVTNRLWNRCEYLGIWAPTPAVSTIGSPTIVDKSASPGMQSSTIVHPPELPIAQSSSIGDEPESSAGSPALIVQENLHVFFPPSPAVPRLPTTPSPTIVHGSHNKVPSPVPTATEVNHGPQLLRQTLQHEQRTWLQYTRRLQVWQGRCIICRLFPGPGTNNQTTNLHDLQHCRNYNKAAFFRAKREAINKGRKRGGWIKNYAACFHCGNPQHICRRQESGNGVCDFPDIVFPAAWALFHRENRFGYSLHQITGRDFETEDEWMSWLGEPYHMDGVQTCRAVFVTSWLLDQLAQVVQ